MPVYPDEPHGRRQEQNQVDYHRRILPWFGRYLKDGAAPAWMTDGPTQIDRVDALERPTGP